MPKAYFRGETYRLRHRQDRLLLTACSLPPPKQSGPWRKRPAPLGPTIQSKSHFLSKSPKPITGHIDAVQARNGFIHLLDHKPKAWPINLVNQLVVYALAFACRTRLPVKGLKCAWFDETDYFEFFPLQAVKTRSAQAWPEITPEPRFS
jgi:hypothetical protein